LTSSMQAPYRFFRHTALRLCAESALAPLHLLFASQTLAYPRGTCRRSCSLPRRRRLALVCAAILGIYGAPSGTFIEFGKRFLVLLNYAGNLSDPCKIDCYPHLFRCSTINSTFLQLSL